MWKVKGMHFPAHVYRSPSVQWTVCMKANVLIYKWVTLGKTWCCAFSIIIPVLGAGCQAHPHWGLQCWGGLPQGQLWQAKGKATSWQLGWSLVGHSESPLRAFVHSGKLLSTFLEPDTVCPVGTRELWTRKAGSKGLSAKAYNIY